MRYLWLIRHGKSEEGAPGQADHDRSLNDRGRRDGGNMTAWFASQPHPAEWIWCSSARRARETAEFVSTGFGTSITEASELYLSSPETLVDVLRQTPVGIESVAVVAHNPGLTYLSNLLSHEEVTDNLVTFGVALFATEAEWSNLVFTHNHFVALHTPKTIKAS